MVLRTDEGTVAVFFRDILLGRKDKGNHRERFALAKRLLSASTLRCMAYQTHAISYQCASAKKRRCANVLRALGRN